jgi:Uma2 family endonuclease
MSTLAPPQSAPLAAGSSPAAQIPPFPIYKISVQRYHDMIRKGVLTEADAVELLEGWIVPKMPRIPIHDAAIDIAEEVIRGHLPQGWRIRVQKAITTRDREPEPDLAVVHGDLRQFVHQHPGPGDIGLLVESADSSRGTDRNDKSRLYARAGIEHYWVINLIDLQIETFDDPDPQTNPPAYRQNQIFRPGQLAPLKLRGQFIASLPVNDLLP